MSSYRLEFTETGGRLLDESGRTAFAGTLEECEEYLDLAENRTPAPDAAPAPRPQPHNRPSRRPVAGPRPGPFGWRPAAGGLQVCPITRRPR